MGVGPIARWRQSPPIELALKLKWALAVSAITAVIAPLVLRSWTPMIGFGFLVSAWIISSGVTQLIDRARINPSRSWWQNLRIQPAGYYGMLLAHFGVAIFIIGVTAVRGFETEQDVRMQIGGVSQSGGYDFKMVSLKTVQGPNYAAVQGHFDVSKNGKPVTSLFPEKRIYTASQMPMTEAAIDSGLTRDLYVSLGEPINENEWSVRIYHKPFVDWIWGGCFLMALGGFLAITDRRYRKKEV
jgi:cytochrome c-type biogenesis protein CcmF